MVFPIVSSQIPVLGKTRWLSLEKAMQRVLQQWPALHAYFDHVCESDHSSRVMRLDQHLKSPLTKLVMHFLEFALESMCKFNAIFQSTLPMLPALKMEVKRLLRILLGRFLKADAIREAEADLTKVNLSNTALYLPNEELGIGHSTWAYLSDVEDYLDSRAKKIFFNGVKDFYIAVASTIIKKFCFKDSVVDDVAIFMPENQASVDVFAVFRLAKHFPTSVSEERFDALEEEVLDYKLAPPSVMPSVHREEGSRRCDHNGLLCSTTIPKLPMKQRQKPQTRMWSRETL